MTNQVKQVLLPDRAVVGIGWVGGENWTVPASLGPGTVPTPEHGTGLLGGLGLVILALKRRNRRH